MAEQLDRTKFSFVGGINRKPVTVAPEDSLGEILQRREEKGYGFESFPVCDKDRKLLGLLTSRHFQRHCYEQSVNAGSVMRPFKDLHVAQEGITVVDASDLLLRFDVKLLPVCGN